MKTWWQQHGRVVFAAAAGAVAGALVRGMLPPFVLDDPFWRAFFSGPPAAGIFAVVAAVVAYAAAVKGARTARLGAERQEWWNRAEWALTLARSDDEVDRRLGLRALKVLAPEATKTEYEMVLAVAEEVTGPPAATTAQPAASVDMSAAPTENRPRRWWPWNKA